MNEQEKIRKQKKWLMYKNKRKTSRNRDTIDLQTQPKPRKEREVASEGDQRNINHHRRACGNQYTEPPKWFGLVKGNRR